MPWAIVGIALTVVASFILYGRASYYRRMFSRAHFEETHSTVLGLLRYGQGSGGSTAERTVEPSGAVTSAGLALCVTRRIAGDAQVVHISLSQHRRSTTAAVANHFAFFLITLLNRNKLDLDLFFTSSRVHHLVLTGSLAALATNDFVATFEIYLATYRPLPFAFRALEQVGTEVHR